MRKVRKGKLEYAPCNFLVDRVTRQYLELERSFIGFVYIIQAGDDGPVKIGSAQAPSFRRGELQVGNWQELHLRAVIPAMQSGYIESMAQVLAGARHIRGEWFDLEPIEAVKFVLTAAITAGIDPKPLKIAVEQFEPFERSKSGKTFPDQHDLDRQARMRVKLGID